MRTLIALTIVLLATVVPVMAQSAADEAAVREATQQYFAATNKHDAMAAAALADDNWQNWAGTLKGKAAYLKMREEQFERMKDLQLTFAEEIVIDFVTPDVAFHKFYARSTGWVSLDGTPSPPTRGRNAFLYVKKNGKWLLRASFWEAAEE